MITLKNEETEFSVESVGYEFPEMKEDRYGIDSNWLNIRIGLKTEDKIFSKVKSVLMTQELREISIWFDTISRNEIPDSVFCRNTEQNIEFQLLFKKDNLITIS